MWKAPDDGELLGTRSPEALAAASAASIAGSGPERTNCCGEFSLARVRPCSAASAAAPSRSLPDGEHAAGLAAVGRVLHGAAARDHDAHAIVVVDRARRGQGADLAERVPGEVLGPRAAQLLIAGDRGAVDGGLRVGGSLGHPLERVLAHELGGELEQIGPNGGDELAAGGVADPLSREEDS